MIEEKPLPQPWKFIVATIRVCMSRMVLFTLCVCLFVLWRKAPPYTPSEMVEIERERLRVEQQREDYERERLRMLGQVLRMNGSAMERVFESPATMARTAKTNTTNDKPSE